MPSECVFELNKEAGSYFSGEIISGTITLKTTSDKNVREVCIIFLGEGKVNWNESHATRDYNGNTSSTSTAYRSHETYVNNSTKVRGDGVLPAGTHTFTFNIPLPLECPTSLEGKYGHIRYELSLKINRYYRFDNIYKKPLTIIRTMDLNVNPSFQMPLVLEDTSSSCCWSCSKGAVLCTLKLPFSAYACGQAVRYILEIANQSMDDIEGYTLEFKQEITFHARSPQHKQRHNTNVLVSKNLPEKCLRLSNRIIEGAFFIPAIPPTTDRGSIICVEYWMEISVELPCCKTNPQFIVPLVIGTIPIRESLNINQIVNGIHQQSFSPSAPEIPTPDSGAIGNNMPPKYSDIMPPTFEEATRSHSPFIDTDVDEKNRIDGFRPLYPVYNS